MRKQVVISILPDGTTSIDAQNFKGKGCQDATNQIALALGGAGRDTSDDKKKPDFFAPGTTGTQTHNV